MIRRWWIWSALVLAIVSIGGGAWAQAPTTQVSIIDQPPLIDGNLAEACWQRPADCRDFKVLDTGKPATQQTAVWLARDDTWLFVAFKCYEAKVGEIECQVQSRDGSVNRDDSVELFISPGTDGKTYYHFMLNAAGVHGDNRSEGAEHHIPWDAHWRSAAVIDPKQRVWTAEIAIPLSYLCANAGEKEWRLNLCRYRKPDPPEFSAWAPIKQSFHEPEHFGRLDGLAGLKPQAVFAPVLQKAAVGALLDFPVRCYPVTVAVRNDGGVAGEITAYAVDITEKGQMRSSDQNLHLDPGHYKSQEITVPIAEFVQRRTQVVLTFRDDLGVWSVVKEIKPERSTKPLSVCMDRSYYTTEAQAHLIADVVLPPAELLKSKLRVRCSWLPKALVTEVKRSSHLIPIKLEGLASSNGTVEVALESGDGRVIAREATKLIKRQPAAAGNEVKTDRWNRSVLVNGKPFFPMGFYGVRPVNYAMAAGMGMNTVIDWDRNTPLQCQARLEAANRNRLYLITVPHWSFPNMPLGGTHPEFPDRLRAGMKEVLPEFLRLCAPHPAALAWYGIDEPGGETLKELCLELTAAIDAGDGHHPNMPLFCRGFPQDGWFDSFDIGLLDIYWTPESGPQAVQEAIGWFKRAERDTRGWNKPFWVTVVGERYSMSSRIMLPKEQRLNTYLALIHGASGVFYFVWPVRHQQTYDMFRTLAREVQTLAPVLLTRTPDQQVVVEGGDEDRIIVLLKAHPEGGGLLLAANTRDEPVQVTVAVSGLERKGKVTSLFGNRKYEVRDGAFSDHLEGLATRAYRIPRMELSDRQAAIIRLKLAPQPRTVAADRPMFNNLVVNAGFETEVGWSNVVTDGPAFYDTAMAKEGQRALCIKRRAGMNTVVVTSQPIQLKPSTRYEFGAWMRGEFTSAPPQWGGPDLSVYSLTAKKGLCFRQTHAAVLSNWCQRSTTFTTDHEPQTVQIYIYGSAKKFVGSAWIDQVYLREIPTEPVSRNMLPNSSFEVATLPGYPDRWGSLMSQNSVTPQTLTGNKNALFAQDDSTAVDGKYSLRVKGFHQISSWGPRFGKFVVQLDLDQTYVFSIYMKADREDMEVWMMLRGPNQWTKVKVGKQWKRYQVTGKPPGGGYRGSLYVDLRTEGDIKVKPEEATTVWFDAAQVELGTEPTAYVCDTYELPAND